MFASLFMACCPRDPEGATDLRTAIGGYPLQNLAADCQVTPSTVTKWLRDGNIPDAQIQRMPDDIRRRFEELRAKRHGVFVVDRDLVQAGVELFWSFFRPVMVKASLESRSRGSLSGRQEREVA